jgi:hypothetical protein
MSNKDVIEKLVKIAESQQKIIRKLAQGMGYAPDSGVTTNMADVTDAVVPFLQQAIQAAGAKAHYGVQSANLSSDGDLQVTLLQPRDADPAEYFNVKNKFKESLMGKTLDSKPVRSVNVIGATA